MAAMGLAALLAATGAEARDTDLVRLDFSRLPGWPDDDHAAAFHAFRVSCAKPAAATRAGRLRGAALSRACAAALAGSPAGAMAFFEQWFEPYTLTDPGFLTAYYEPVLSGSLQRDARHSAPVLSWPTGDTSSLPDRTAIEEGALAGRSRALLYLDPVDLFVTQVQGSARVRLADGRLVRLAYAGRNGKPYTAIGKVLVDRGLMALENVTMDSLVAWMRANPREGLDLMRENKSYVFFRIDTELDPMAGPVGGAGVSLTPGRSLAVDRKVWPYGLPVWVEATNTPLGDVRRLTVAQDTGTAIVGSGRADLFLGSGEEAGRQAGQVKHPMRMVVLLPKER